MSDANAARAFRLGLGPNDSLEFLGDGEANLTLRLDADACYWFASHLPPNDECSKLFSALAERLESEDEDD